jgi:hypothetical protein
MGLTYTMTTNDVRFMEKKNNSIETIPDIVCFIQVYQYRFFKLEWYMYDWTIYCRVFFLVRLDYATLIFNLYYSVVGE